METINLRINGIAVTIPKGPTILGAARLAHIEVPTLCFLKEIGEIGAYRICIVELKNGRLVASCVYPAEEGMEAYTNTPKVLDSGKKTLQLLLSNHNRSCLSCVRSGRCELQELTHELGVDDKKYYGGEVTPSKIDTSAVHMIHDNSKYIPRRRCMAVCENVQGVGVIGANNHGFSISIGSAFEMSLGETFYVSYGQCIAVCPTGALAEEDYTADVSAVIADPKKHVTVQAAPAVYAGLSEEFGLPIGTGVENKMTAALHRLGFDEVFDTSFSTDLTIIKKVHEFIDRVQNGGVLPLITSYSPGWAKCYEHYFPDMTEDLPSCKSPQQMSGATAESYYTEEASTNPKDIVSANVMPCTAKKFEIGRKDEDANGVPGVDISITTRELARMIKKAGIQFLDLPNEEFDTPPGPGTGTAVIFGATGDVMEATLRTVVETLTGGELSKSDLTEARGTKGIKETTYNVADVRVKIAVASGLGSARELLNKMRSGEANYHLIEIMGCPGDYINGGGQPQQPGHVRNTTDICGLRTKVLYDIDTANPIHEFHENPAIRELYATYLGEPGSEKAHHLLRTTYVKRSINQH